MSVKRKVTLITGADGLIGSAIRRLNPTDTVYLGRSDLDLRDFVRTVKVFTEIRPTHVIHAAAVVGGIGSNLAHQGSFFRDNVMINLNVLEAARLAEVKKLVSFVSTCAFPDKITYPLREQDIHDGPPHFSNFGYAYAKRMLDVQSRAYRQEWGCDYVVAVGTNIYGPQDNFSIENGHVLPALIHKCFLAKQQGVDLSVWGSGEPLREFVFSEDVGRLALWALDEYNEDSPILFSSGVENSIKEAVALVVEKMRFKGRVLFDTSKPNGQFRKPSDTTKLQRYQPNFQFTSLDEGITRTVQWFLENYEHIRK